MSALPNTSRFSRTAAPSTVLGMKERHRNTMLVQQSRIPATSTSCTTKENNTNRLGDLRVVIPKDLRQPMADAGQQRYYEQQQQQPEVPAPHHNNDVPKKRTHKPVTTAAFDVPQVLFDKKRNRTYTRLHYLGEGGFAKCYKVKTPGDRMYAAKVIPKSTLHDPKNKTKLLAEINIHRSLNYKSIVRFHSCFEDSRNVYLIVELCDNKTLVEMLKRRGRLTEPEVRYFLIQILDACRYLHDNRVIHRDIKLSNVFLDKNCDVKIGDFGLAAILVSPQDRKRTVCGTPNYIAPEILFKTGHDSKVDLWSIGVLMFTLLVGKHPFQQKDVKHIYKKIRENSDVPSYEFPSDIYVSNNAKDLIGRILVNKPELRPSVPETLRHPFFQEGLLPCAIPVIALTRQPTERELFPSSVPQRPIIESPGKAGEVLRDAINEHKSYVDRRTAAPIRIMSERLVDPRSHFPLPPPDPREALQPKVISEPGPTTSSIVQKREIMSSDDQPRKRRDLEIPAQLQQLTTPEAPAAKPAREECDTRVPSITPPIARIETASNDGRGSRPIPRPSVLETMLRVLRESLSDNKAQRDGTAKTIEPIVWTDSNIFLDKWVDFSSKYGLGYSLTDGTRGALFNDSTTLTTKDGISYFFVSHCDPTDRRSFTTDTVPDNLRKKCFIMRNFREYMEKKLARMATNMPERINGTTGSYYLTKYVVTDRAVIFRLSNQVVQFNFFNHSKLILTDYGTKVIYIASRSRNLLMYHIEDAVTSGDTQLLDMLSYAHQMLEEQVAAGAKMLSGSKPAEK
ncbi:kinase-like domain-containing protein [Dichotomocladium elegans]|nr:kinase-like domain-containing protein [Dichotomocladium elegans]